MTVALIVETALIALVSVAAIVLIVVGHVGKGIVTSRMWN